MEQLQRFRTKYDYLEISLESLPGRCIVRLKDFKRDQTAEREADCGGAEDAKKIAQDFAEFYIMKHNDTLLRTSGLKWEAC